MKTSKIRCLFGLSMLVGSLLVSVAPAFAEFEGLGGLSKCTSSVINTCGKNAAAIFLKVNTSTFECPVEQALIERWTIQVAEVKEEKQAEATRGPHEEIEFSCAKGKAIIGGTSSPAKLLPGCAVQIEPTEGTKSELLKGKVTKECKLSADAELCKIKVPGGKSNQNLKSAATKVSAENTLLKFNVAGVESTPTGACGYKAGELGEFTGENVSLVGQMAVT